MQCLVCGLQKLVLFAASVVGHIFGKEIVQLENMHVKLQSSSSCHLGAQWNIFMRKRE
jgi:hypothetical protein